MKKGTKTLSKITMITTLCLGLAIPAYGQNIPTPNYSDAIHLELYEGKGKHIQNIDTRKIDLKYYTDKKVNHGF